MAAGGSFASGESRQFWKHPPGASCDSVAIARWCRSLAQIGLPQEEEAVVPESGDASDAVGDCGSVSAISDEPFGVANSPSQLRSLVEGALAPLSVAVERFSVRLDGESERIVGRIEDLSARLSAIEGWACRLDMSMSSFASQLERQSCTQGSLDAQMASALRARDEAQQETSALHQKIFRLETVNADDQKEVVELRTRLEILRKIHEERGLEEQLAAQITNTEMNGLRTQIQEMQEHLSTHVNSKDLLHVCHSELNETTAEIREKDCILKKLESSMEDIKSELRESQRCSDSCEPGCFDVHNTLPTEPQTVAENVENVVKGCAGQLPADAGQLPADAGQASNVMEEIQEKTVDASRAMEGDVEEVKPEASVHGKGDSYRPRGAVSGHVELVQPDSSRFLDSGGGSAKNTSAVLGDIGQGCGPAKMAETGVLVKKDRSWSVNEARQMDEEDSLWDTAAQDQPAEERVEKLEHIGSIVSEGGQDSPGSMVALVDEASVSRPGGNGEDRRPSFDAKEESAAGSLIASGSHDSRKDVERRACVQSWSSRTDLAPEQASHSESLDYSVRSEARLQIDCDMVEAVRLAAAAADAGDPQGRCSSHVGTDVSVAHSTADPQLAKDLPNDFDDSFEIDADDDSSGDVVLVGQMLSSPSILFGAQELNSSKEASETPTDAWSAKPLQFGGLVLPDYEDDFESP